MNDCISVVIGVDLGDKQSHICVIDRASGEVLEESVIPTKPVAFERWFGTKESTTIACEVGTHSPWVSELLEGLGHEVLVANPRQLRLIYRNRRKNDKVDARYLAKLARLDPDLLFPLTHRKGEARADLSLLRSREALVKSRTQLINHVRGAVKSTGHRLPSCSSGAFKLNRLSDEIPAELKSALLPVLGMIDGLTATIRGYDKQIDSLAEKYPAAGHLMTIGGVGPITASAYVLTIEDPERFAKSRSVGAYLGLAPGSDESGESNPQKRITKQGDEYLRKLLVSAAHYIIGPFGKDCDLRRHGLKIAARGGKNARKRAAVAVARKLAVLMHCLWINGTVYDPLYNSRTVSATAEQTTST